MAHLAGRDQVLHRAGDVLDGDVRIDAVLVEKSMRSVPRRRSIASVGRLMCSGWLLSPRRSPVVGSTSKPNFVAMTAKQRESGWSSPGAGIRSRHGAAAADHLPREIVPWGFEDYAHLPPDARQGELRTLTTNANRADRGFQFFRSVGLCEGRAYYNRARWHQGARGNSRLQAILPTPTEGRDSNRTPL